jgi:polyisoprenyl-teichoic acid--peptidoglycan teichoic acid transferase
MARKKSALQIQAGRSLPNKFSSYSPGRPANAPQQPSISERQTVNQAKPKLYKRIIAICLLTILACFVIIGSWDARNISSASQKLFASGNVLSFLNASSLKTDANGRVYVLIAGYSADDPGHAGATLTDSIMLLSMNPVNKTGYMLSVPRDLYVKIPGFGYGKINEAYNDGGMELLREIVQDSFDIQVGYYTLVNYAAVHNIVDALGGIDVTINSPDGRLYDPNKDWTTGGPLVNLSNGPHHLNGQQALDLTRARGDPSQYGYAVGFGQSDFQRTADQRLVFTAIKNKMSWKLILDPRKNSKILNATADNIKTNVGIDEARPLFNLFNSIPSAKLQSLSLRDLNGHNYLVSSAYDGDTLTPAAGLSDYSQINTALSQIN